MTRLIDRAITDMVLDSRRCPQTWTYQGQRWRIERVLESWKDAGAWWDGELEKTFWRVIPVGGGIVELWQDSEGAWALYRIWD